MPNEFQIPESLKELTPTDKAVYAQQLIDNPIFVGMLREIEKNLVRDWGDTSPTQVVEREALWSQIQALKKIEGILVGYINEFKIDEMNKVKRGEKTKDLKV